MKIDENNFKTLDKVSETTGTDYDIMWVDKEEKRGYIFVDNMYSMIEDLLMEVERLQETLEDTKKYYNDNYKPISPYEMYGISENEFH